MKARCKLCGFEYSITGIPEKMGVKHFFGTSNNFCSADSNDWEIINRERKDCSTCKHKDVEATKPPCLGCYNSGNMGDKMFPKWTSNDSK